MKKTGYKASREGDDELSLIVYDLFGEKRDKVQRAIDLVRSFEPPDKYYLAYSGGKDSIVVEAILRMAGVGYDIHYNMTTVDPPELVRFVIRQFEAVIYDLPDGSFKYFTVNSGGRLLSPATAQSIAGKRCIHFTIPKLSMRQLPPRAVPRPQAIPADPTGAVLLRGTEGISRRGPRGRDRRSLGRERG